MSRRVLVTGATGFIGRALVPYLASQGYSVHAAARRPDDIAAAPGVAPVSMPDLGARVIAWEPLLAGVTHIVHLAGLAHVTASIPEADYMAVNARATASLATAARRAGVERLLLVSSVRACSGPASSRILFERDEPRPTDAYGRSKLAAEQALADALRGDGTQGVVLRPVLVYGPGVKGNMAALFRLARLRVPLPLGALDNRRSIVSLGNLASAIAHSLRAPRAAGGTFFVADAEPVSVARMIAHLRAGLGRGPGLVRLPLAPVGLALRLIGRGDAWARIAGDLVVDTSSLRATGWQPPQTTAEALAAAIRADERRD